MSNLKERLLEFIDYKHLTKAEFEREVGLSNGFVDKAGDGTRRTSLNKISAKYPDLNQNWLLTGDGNMLKTIEAVPISLDTIIQIPLVGKYAYAGYLGGYGDEEYLEALPTIPFIPDHEVPKGTYMAFEVKGDSMDDGTKEAIEDGDRLACREIPQHNWADSKLHIKKWDFVIVHKTEGILIKRIIKHDVEKRRITIHSLNLEYEDRDIFLKDVAKIFNVIEVTKSRKR